MEFGPKESGMGFGPEESGLRFDFFLGWGRKK